MQTKMKKLDMKESYSKSLLANVLDMEDDYQPITQFLRFAKIKDSASAFLRSSASTPPEFEHFALSGIHRELVNILKEIQVISNKIRNDDEAASVENDWKFAAMVLDRLCLITFREVVKIEKK